MPMIYACGLNHHIDGITQTPTQFLDDTNTKPNPTYTIWLRQNQLVLSWIVASVSESILPQLVGAVAARAAWDKLIAAYALGSRPYICELKTQLYALRRDNANIESSLESRQKEINFDALYGLLLNEEALTVIAPTTQYTQSSFSTTRGRGRGRGGRGHGRFSNQDFQLSQNRPEEVTIGNGSKIPISHIGKNSVVISDKKFNLDDILHDLVMKDMLHTCSSEEGLYSLPVMKSSAPASYVASLGVWHARLAHTSFPTVRQVLSSSAIVPSFKSSDLCSTCAVSKSHKVPFHESSFQASGPLDLVCSDVWGPAPVASNEGH
ncbi:hypothetical protein KY289_008521 [Solanum tuberosum]|nr:hypothetical protein KY289_008521 [Solanum tuberosum]